MRRFLAEKFHFGASLFHDSKDPDAQAFGAYSPGEIEPSSTLVYVPMGHLLGTFTKELCLLGGFTWASTLMVHVFL